ncbi:MAG: hypothetical protein H6953_14705 [Chromatiaceae bacterium]|nr:hypothetical protein [Chromatiaceae bacterium]MCP5421807.1 hypothetical protein [Chromatiaceae bacterium]
MAYIPFGSAKIGMNKVELRGNTGTVSGSQKSTQTQTTVDYDKRTTTQRTSHWIEFALNLDDGRIMQITAPAYAAPVKNGDRVTSFWGQVNNKERPDYLAFYNHTTDNWGLNKDERNFIAGPIGHAYWGILSIFLALGGFALILMDGVDVGSVIMVGLCAYFFYAIIRRRKKLLKLLSDAIEELRAGNVPSTVESN